jgi:valyl-tRNA synthetase
MTLDKIYNPDLVEDNWIEKWEENNIFAIDETRIGKPTFSIVIPPPNVTGSLHMGHALNTTIQDIMIRYHRMIGDDTLWVVGVDHAGIATQMVVERQLAEKNLTRHDLGREKFIEKIWEWKEESGGTIINQLKKLGASCDFKNQRFTMDEGLSDAVVKVFVELYKKGLIYRDKKLVNWDPKLHTAISDLEVVSKNEKGNLWHLKYELVENPGKYIVVATTRPETLFGDTAVAVHPDDDRYKNLVGQKVKLPLTNREIPIVADEHADPEHGSGAVKITPAHDFNDFEVGLRHDLEQINILTIDAKLNENTPESYQGLDRYKAREKALKELEKLELIDQIEKIQHTVPYGDRSNVVVEPYLTDQWFVKAEVLAEPALKAVENDQTKFIPKHWEKTYFEWLRNIKPWCISRQIWWGHQIPAWFGPDGEIFVEENEEIAYQKAKDHYGKEVDLKRETDVLDTWFSSALWPFSTLGWPEKTSELKRYYPTNCLVTGFDIIFFWVARMMMMGIHFMDEIPFHDVHIHALVRDPTGQKMSKSKGNVVDPLSMMKKYGTDAFRFTLTAFAAQGRDIKLDETRISSYRNFCNKIWNASRFVFMSCEEGLKDFEDLNIDEVKHPLNQWLIYSFNQTIIDTTDGITQYEFNRTALSLYHFFWQDFCDWFLECSKDIYKDDDEELKIETKKVTLYILDQALKLLHPIMPFITEEIWHMMGDRKDRFISTEEFPTQISLKDEFKKSYQEIKLVRETVTNIRSIRQETGVALHELVPVMIKPDNSEIKKVYEEVSSMISTLGKVSDLTLKDDIPEDPLAISKTSSSIIAIPLTGLIDLEKEKSRQEKRLAKVNKEKTGLENQLNNPKFKDHAPVELIDEKNLLLKNLNDQIELINEALKRLN